MPARKLAYPLPARPPREMDARSKADAIVVRRDRLMTELARLREHSAGSQFVENAHKLLTRQWSGASWKAREGLLDAAAWLLNVERSREPDVVTTV